VLLSLVFLSLERFFRTRQRYYSQRQGFTHQRKTASRLSALAIWSWLLLITLFAFGLPLAWMLSWSWSALIHNAITIKFWEYAWNSLTVAVLAASAAVVVALPVALFHTRHRSRLSNLYLQLASVGFVLPGPVIALGILSFVLATLPLLYGGVFAVVLALAIRFLPLAIQSQDAALQQLTPSVIQAGRILGASPLENLWRVILPMIRKGMTGAWVLVFIDSLKELPATLLLRPTGFDTLPVRIWIEASEEMLELAAPAALLLVIGTLPVLWIMLREKP
jgi:iron(III) transport system permease protein